MAHGIVYRWNRKIQSTKTYEQTQSDSQLYSKCKLIKFKTDPGGGGRGAKITEEAGTQQSMRRHRHMVRETHRHIENSEQVRAGQNQEVRSTPSAATGE